MYLSDINAYSGIGNLQNRSAFSLFSPAGKAQTALQKLSDQIVTGQKGGEVSGNAAQIAQIKKDSYVPKGTSDDDPLADVREDVLRSYMDSLRIESASTWHYGRKLSDFKAELQGMDGVIQGYQDILDGKTPLPEGRSMESISLACKLAKVERDRHFEFEMDRFERYSGADYYDKEYERVMELVTGECRFAHKSDADWRVNRYASDIYAEIDRVLANINGRVEEANQGIVRIYGTLYKRGYGEKYRRYLDFESDVEPADTARSVASWKQNIEQLWQTPMKEAEETPLQTSMQDFLLK